jgi:chaperonin GroEL
MNIKEVKFNQEAKKPLIKGINIVCDAVATTMGYRGRTVLIESPGGLPIVTKDGVSVAEAIFLEDASESLGAEIVKQACRKTVNEAGDSTTCTAVLTKAILKVAEDALNSGVSAIDVKKGIDEAVRDTIEYIKSEAVSVDDDYIYDVAKISSNNDEDLGKIIADAFIKAGKNGVVSYEQSETSKTYLEFVDGMPIARGWEFEGFINKPENRSIEFSNEPRLLLSNRKFQNIREILPIVEHCHKNNQELFIVSEMEFEVMKVLYANKKNGLRVAVITPPSIGEKRRDYLTDIALATNALVVDLDTSTNLEAYSPEDLLGKCNKIIATKEDTVLFFNERFNSDKIKSKINELNEVIKNSNNKLEKDYLKDRISKLACGVSIIKVGSITEVELKEKLDRVDDAINAVKSAIAEGVISGGGLTLFNASLSIGGDKNVSQGYSALKEAIKEPMNTILINAGLNPLEVQNELLKLEKEIGYDVKDYKFINMFKGGIIDPAKAIRLALENAASVATTVLLTNTTITHKRDESSFK